MLDMLEPIGQISWAAICSVKLRNRRMSEEDDKVAFMTRNQSTISYFFNMLGYLSVFNSEAYHYYTSI